ncbi:TRAP transporter small permease [Calidifontibacillus oryziterrae]|uniref:TRAP transporter small permease n=1 Tax=Calidifontibacillus oryziterrae TaxID=1191699 RepID=UPI0002FE40C8|nr:TRAP transporter small permease [Calidifontibacillus oryziterrae]
MKKVVDGLNNVVKYILYLLLTILIIAVFAQVVFRFVLEQPLAWTEELARYCLVWITFLGAAYAMSKKAHIGLEFFKDRLPKLGRDFLTILSALVSIAFFVILLVQGYELVNRSMAQLSPVLRLPMGVVYAVMPISAILLIINTISITIHGVKGGAQR